MAVNFWRPVAPMQRPVKKAPLAVCDPDSVKLEERGGLLGAVCFGVFFGGVKAWFVFVRFWFD